jgi:hypothetical protein
MLFVYSFGGSSEQRFSVVPFRLPFWISWAPDVDVRVGDNRDIKHGDGAPAVGMLSVTNKTMLEEEVVVGLFP